MAHSSSVAKTHVSLGPRHTAIVPLLRKQREKVAILCINICVCEERAFTVLHSFQEVFKTER